jgi:hypothetical protein
MKYLINAVETYRVDTVEEAEQLHETLKNDSHFSLTAFGYKTKVKKEKGDIVEEWQLVTVKKEFNDEKEPVSSVHLNYEVD